MAQLSLDRGVEVLGRRAKLVRIALFGFIILSVSYMLTAIGEGAGLIDLEGGDGPDSYGLLGAISYGLYAISLFASFILVSMWIYRAHANLHAAGIEGLQYSPGWAVGWYFVPIANLFKPIEAMRELRNESLANVDGGSSQIGYWWACWIIGNILSNASTRIGFSYGGGLAQPGLILDCIGTVVTIMSAWFLSKIVAEVTAGQDSVMNVAEVFS